MLDTIQSAATAQVALLVCSHTVSTPVFSESALNALAAINSVVDLNKIEQIVKVTGFISGGPDFTQQSAIMNGASDLLQEIFGDAGKHARTSIGVASLPLGAPVEVELLVRLAD